MASTRLGALVGAAVLSASALAGCGESTSSDGSDTGIGPSLAAPINLADCTDWQQASVEERLGTIGQIREFVGGPVPGSGGGRGVALEDEQAYDLFENYCENEFARGFKLYKLYSRAAAFSGR
jgi:hypothetical protein